MTETIQTPAEKEGFFEAILSSKLINNRFTKGIVGIGIAYLAINGAGNLLSQTYDGEGLSGAIGQDSVHYAVKADLECVELPRDKRVLCEPVYRVCDNVQATVYVSEEGKARITPEGILAPTTWKEVNCEDPDAYVERKLQKLEAALWKGIEQRQGQLEQRLLPRGSE